MNPFVQYDNIIPLLAPQDIASTVTASSYMDLKTAQRAGFLVVFGAITSATTTNTEVVTVESASVETAAEAAIAFNYRLSGALGANTWGAITASGATGVEMTTDDDNKILWIEIDPSAVEAANAGHRFVRVKLTDNDDMGACLVAVLGVIEPRYKANTMISATAAASA